MKLLLAAVAVCAVWPRSVLTKPSYSINNSPFETNGRQYGQNPAIPERVNRINEDNPRPAIPKIRSAAPEASFKKRSVQAFPLAPQQKTYEEDQFDDGDIPLRSAVEYIPIEAEVYSHLRNPDVYSDDSLQFNREGVESLPFFPTPYTGGFNDEVRDAFVVEVDDEYDQIGNRGNVEAHPIFGHSGQTNGRPYGQLADQYSDGHIPIVDNEVDFVTPYRASASARSTGTHPIFGHSGQRKTSPVNLRVKRTEIKIGPVSISFGKGKDAVVRSATAESPELTGKMHLSVAANGKAKITRFNIVRPSVVTTSGTLNKDGARSDNNNFMANSIARMVPMAAKQLKLTARDVLQATESKK